MHTLPREATTHAHLFLIKPHFIRRISLGLPKCLCDVMLRDALELIVRTVKFFMELSLSLMSIIDRLVMMMFDVIAPLVAMISLF